MPRQVPNLANAMARKCDHVVEKVQKSGRGRARRLLRSALGALVLAAASSCTPKVVIEPPTVDVRQTAPSPDGAWLAVVLRVHGGGAAGYDYDDVLLRTPIQDNSRDYSLLGLQTQGLSFADVEWLDRRVLLVRYAGGEPSVNARHDVSIVYVRK